VVALGRGGALETVVEGATGRFFSEPTPAALLHAQETLDAAPPRREDCRAQALRFRRERFLERLARAIEQTLAGRM